MRRATIQALRAARRGHETQRRLIRTRHRPLSVFYQQQNAARLFGPNSTQEATQQTRTLSKFQPEHSRLGQRPSFRILESSFLFRNFATFLVGVLAAGGAWWAFNSEESGSNGKSLRSLNNSPSTGGKGVYGQIANSPSVFQTGQPGATIDATNVEVDIAEQTRRALVVEDDQFFAGDIVGNEPISKEVNDSGRLVVEMLTPEQATQKLRQNEASYLVDRGQGVVRYDVSQVASNNPIEDDHAEKIVQHNENVGAVSSDWMFWGVFDGHA